MIKTKVGTIVSDKMTETAIVSIERMVEHKMYRKKYRVTKRFKAHNPENKYKTGDIVIISETKPMSKEKSWQITGLAGKSEGGK